MNILITSVGTATSVNLIKYFKKGNDYIVGCDINDIGFTAGSLLADKFYKAPLATARNYLNFINDIITKEHIDIFIPVNDIEVDVISSAAVDFSSKVVIPAIETINLIKDKFVCSSKMAEDGFCVPEILSEDDLSVKRILRDRIGVGSKGIQFFDKNILAKKCDESNFLQKAVEGQEYTVDVLCDNNGKPYYIVPRKRLEVKAGVATKAFVENNSELINIVCDMLKNIKIPGFSNFQFIKSQDKYYFIEINYRFSGCGAATLATCNDYLDVFRKIAFNDYAGLKEMQLNHDVRFNSVVTRYYEEVVYENSFS